jgi:hypothetical protein
MTRTSLFRTVTAATAVLAVSATLAACGGGGSSDSAPESTRVKNNAFTTVPSDGGAPTTLFDWTGGSSTTVAGGTDTTAAPTDSTAAPTDSTTAVGDTTVPAAGDTTVPAAGDTTVPAATAGEAISLVQSKGQSGDAFGGAVVLSTDGSTLAVGALYADVNGNADQGSVTVFTRSGGKWAEQGVLTVPGAANDWFGYSIAMSSDGSTIAVGAVYATVDGNKAQGSASVFARSGGKWALEKTVTGKDGAAGDLFGYSVSLSADGATLAVGATGSDAGGNADQGSASVFTRSGGWALQATLTTATPAAKANFGTSVALSADGNTLAVGGPNAGAGAANVFTRANGAWS